MVLDFLGTGWSFPPTFRKENGGVDLVSGVDDIQQSMEILLTTLPGERVMQPEFGAGMERLIFEPFNTTLKTYMEKLIERAIQTHEPRVILNAVTLEAAAEEGLIWINIDYTIASTNTRNNYVFPYYKDEGSEIRN